MKGAIASVEIYAQRGEEPIQRLSLVVGAPAMSSSERGAGDDESPAEPTAEPAAGRAARASSDAKWTCRVALANLQRPVTTEGLDSFEVLSKALRLGRDWLAALEADGFALYRDRGKQRPYRLE